MAVGVPALLPGRLLLLPLLAVKDELLVDALEGAGENMMVVNNGKNVIF
jgi:hypothetical protein